ncbi:hypothetical protein DSN97_09010 [Deferribacteraceae bacterium V6Fe1]|nr:hypothetical protein DSN97_09010 [Deferribacteraceae bacterium V6Fe1]
MKKIITVLVISLSIVSFVYAACDTGQKNTLTLGSVTFDTGLSQNVTLCATSDNSSYTAASKHLNGNAVYQTTESTDISLINDNATNVGKTLSSDNGTVN